jgi:hypothetical protein
MTSERLQAGNSCRSPVVTGAELLLDTHQRPGLQRSLTVPRILILILVASLAVIAAGCGSKPTSSGVAQLPSATTTTNSSQGGATPTTRAGKEDAVYRYSSCMRTHGVPKFPDPKQASGGGMSLAIGPEMGVDPKSPQFQAAEKACRKLLPGGGKAPSPAQLAKDLAQMLKFSACMRAHGLPDFPDPTSSGGGIQLSIGGKKGSGLNPSSPVFQAAQKACQSVMPGPKLKGGGSTELRVGGPSTGSAGGK